MIPEFMSSANIMEPPTNGEDLMEKGEALTPIGSETPGLESSVEPNKAEEQTTHNFFIRKVKIILATFRKKRPSSSYPGLQPREPIVRTLEQCPPGYPRLAALLSSDENFSLYRRFSYLHARLLLYKQDELRELEADLDHLDAIDENEDPSLLRSREKDDALSGRRRKLMLAIEEKFGEYAKILAAARDMEGYNRPPRRDYLSVKRYFEQVPPVCNVESYIFREEDIITLKPGRESAWLDDFVERAVQKLSCKIIRKLFCSSEQHKKADPESSKVILHSRRRLDIIASLINFSSIIALLILPVYILLCLTRSSQMGSSTGVVISVLLVFTLIFTAVLALFTRAKRHEILASAAAYCAVLVVFVGNVGQISPG
ncbi:hypothetical protein L207DRAFT_582474 [Hyaloscypha variabilis F]|uniref:DUF6594 domain-containing protein n=1 Tax=Hyaloscypha variabilis (strain UAMH 11265 / GT02V1 / F) TaxID=1149755 RepID=A0A2J6RP13_HYAVF|nr:hypothetical protein L207DRAFT_582474 [Hyaloscypha variabilis F]